MKYRSSLPIPNSHESELTSLPPQVIESTQNDFPLVSNPVQQYHQQSQRLSQSFTGLMSGLHGAVQVSVSSSSVVFDGTHTHVEAEEQHFRDGRWSQQKLEGSWEGDQSAEAINQLSRATRLNSRLRSRPKVIRPLPRANKTK